MSSKVVFTGKYYTDKDPPPENIEDPSLRKLHLAKYWDDLREELPTIIINAQSLDNPPAGISEISGSDSEKHALIVTNLRAYTVSIRIATVGEATTEDLGEAINLIFEEFTDIYKAYLYKEVDTNWEVRFPLRVDPGTVDRIGLHEDPTKSIWVCTKTLANVQFENNIYVPIDQQVTQELLDRIYPIFFNVSQRQEFATSTGAPGQSFEMEYNQFVVGTMETTANGTYTVVSNFDDSGPSSKHVTLAIDEYTGCVTVSFGNGVKGEVPPLDTRIKFIYRTEGGRGGYPEERRSPPTIEITLSATIPIGQPQNPTVNFMPPNSFYRIDDLKKAVFTSSGQLIARRKGTFKLQVYDTRSGETLAEKTITVI